MPQFVPFYFVSQLSYALLSLLVLSYFYAIYFVPKFTQLKIGRMYLANLG